MTDSSSVSRLCVSSPLRFNEVFFNPRPSRASRGQKNAAFTLIELLIVLASVAALFLWINFATGRTIGRRDPCTTNLKHLALAFVLWSQDHRNHFPTELPASEGGTREAALAGNSLPTFLVISNELRTPALLICPEDKKRKPAKTFIALATTNVSYFLNVDATSTHQDHILAGDRNLSMAGSPVKPGLLQSTNSNDLAWTKGSHDHGGNIALVDGSAHQVTTKGLRDLLTAAGPTNRLIIP